MSDSSTTDDLLRQVLAQLKVTRNIPSTALALRQAATMDSAAHVRADPRFNTAQVCLLQHEALGAALAAVKDTTGLVAEFGVHKGKTLTQIARRFPDVTVHGFDSFVGLPEAWSGTALGAGAFDIGGEPPVLPVSNVEFHVGWFDTTVPAFAASTSGHFRFAHLDADLYSSTKTVFDHLGDRFVPGTILVFDEYFGFHGWQFHEHRAFEEFLTSSGLDFEAVAIGHMNLAVQLIRR